MSIQGQINRIAQNVSDTYSTLNDLGASMPAQQTSDSLAATAGSVTAVLYGKAQNLTDEQKAQARENIGVEGDGGVNEIVEMTADEYDAMTTEEKASLYAQGVRVIAVEDSVDMDELTDQQKFMNAAFPVGACYTTATNVNPASVLGVGTWELVDKLFKERSVSSSTTAYTYDTTNCQSGSISFVASGHDVRCLISTRPSVSLGKDNLLFGTVDLSQLGLTRLTRSQYIIGTGDGANGFLCASLNSTTGEFTHYHGTKNDGSTITSGAYLYYTFTITGTMDTMLDSACDKFVWRRTA